MVAFLLLGLFTIFITIDAILQKPTLYFYKYAPVIHYTSYYQNNTICSKINKNTT